MYLPVISFIFDHMALSLLPLVLIILLSSSGVRNAFKLPKLPHLPQRGLGLCVGLCFFLQIEHSKAAVDLQPMNDRKYNEIVKQATKEELLSSEAAMETVPSRQVKVTMADAMKSTNPVDQFLLDSIPSYKYFKVINKEYSSRSTRYKEGKENPFAAFQ